MIDDGMGDSALAKIAERERHDIAATWNAIRADLKQAGPFAKMILSFRASAIEAITELAFVDPKNIEGVTRLQNEIRRYVSTIEMIHGYRDGSLAAEAAEEIERISDDDRDFLTTLEEPSE